MSQINNDPYTPAESRESRASELTRQLLAGLFGKGDQRTFTVRLWNGETVPIGSLGIPQFTLVLTHPGSQRRMFFPPGELTLAEAYLGGNFDIEGDIFAAMGLASRFESLSSGDWLHLARQVHSLPDTTPPDRYSRGRQRARLQGARYSRARDRADNAYHYDVGNDYYSLFLGR